MTRVTRVVEAARQQFVMIPLDWIDDPDIGADELAMLVVMRRHANHQDGTFAVRQAVMATRLKRSRPWANAVIDRLESLGRVERYRLEGRRCCGYRLPDIAAFAAGQPADTAPVTVCPQADSRSQPRDTEQNPDNNFYSRPSRATSTDRSESGPPASGNQSGVTPASIRSARPTAAGTADTAAAESAGHSAANANPGASNRSIPDLDWQPADSDLIWALQHYPTADLSEHTALFIARSRAKGYQFCDINAAWRAWLIDDQRRERQAALARDHQPTGPMRPRTTATADRSRDRMAAWAAAAAMPPPTGTACGYA